MKTAFSLLCLFFAILSLCAVATALARITNPADRATVGVFAVILSLLTTILAYTQNWIK